MRIVRNRAKFLYIVVAFAVPGIILSELTDVSSGAAAAFWTWLALAVSTTAIWLATRWFRVPEEDIASPRARWRMTGRPTAGFVLGGLWGIGIVFSVWTEIYGHVVDVSPYASPDGPGGLPFTVVSTVVDALLTFVYFRSSIRLNRAERGVAAAR